MLQWSTKATPDAVKFLTMFRITLSVLIICAQLENTDVELLGFDSHRLSARILGLSANNY